MNDSAKQNRTESETLPLGVYLVGDPCYAFSPQRNNLWQDWLKDSWRGIDPNQQTVMDGRVGGLQVAAVPTAFGDGAYADQDGFVYSVDAGLLGAVRVSHLHTLYPMLAGMSYDYIEHATLMRVVTFTEPFTVSFDADTGTVRVGHLRIETGVDET